MIERTRWTRRELVESVSRIVAGEVAAGSWPRWHRADLRAEVRGRVERMVAAGFVAEERAPVGPEQLSLGGG